MAILRSLMENPRYALMRGVARFGSVRHGVAGAKRLLTERVSEQLESRLEAQMGETLFSDLDRRAFVEQMRRGGCAFGLVLPSQIISTITAYAESHPVFAFRNEKHGFLPRDRARAEALLGKEILLAQYFNSEQDCAVIRQIATDPVLQWIALSYLGSVPNFLGCNLWWTYPVRPNREDQLKHAHFFHRDIDDFKFIKFFFYLTDVQPGDGGHWVIAGSHRKSPHIRFKDYFVTRRFDDAEVGQFYARRDILEVTGASGVGFAEDTLCVHKAASPSKMPRLILQLQFALFDFGAGSDLRRPADLRMIDGLEERPTMLERSATVR
jgi:hypothetical protein